MPRRRRRSANTMQITLPFGPGTARRQRDKTRRTPRRSGDWTLLALIVILSLIGLVMVYTASSILAERSYDDSFYFIKKQLQWSLLGFAAFMMVSRLETDRLREWIFPMTVSIFVLMASVLIFGAEVNGSRRWIALGPVSFQPSEIAKLFAVIYLAHYIAKKDLRLGRFVDGAVPPLIVMASLAVLILIEPDFGTTIVILSISLILLFLGGIPMTQVVILLGFTLPVAYYWVVSSPYRLKRITAFMNPWEDRYGSGLQMIQSQIALGSGGLSGTGLAEGKQILFFLPEPHTDFIFAVIGESFGLLGTTLVLTLFVLILWRGLRISLMVETPFQRMLAIGMTLLITLPALLNMGVVTGLLPTKGLPLPFLSYGGSSLLANSVAVAFLYNISRNINERKGFSPLWEGLS